MNLSTADKCSEVIELAKSAEEFRSPQRALLNSFFNGEPPWTQAEAKANRILINFNSKQGCNLLHQARNQYQSAFGKRSTYFKVTLPSCKHELCSDWETAITLAINKPMKNSRPWYYTQDEVWGGVVLHGVSAKMWHDDQSWRPTFVGIQDILIPTDTTLSMENLQWFAVRRKMRPGELYKRTLARGKDILPGWNLPAVKKILDDVKDLNSNPNNYDWANNPEAMTELVKQSSGLYYDTDKSPEIWFWDFWQREEGQNNGKQPGWYHRMILDKDCVTGRQGSQDSPIAFVYDNPQPEATTLDEFIHFQFGDGNNVPPFMYHSIRSLAYLTYELVWTLNRLQCQWTQHGFEQLMTLLRITDPSDRARLEKVVLTPPYGIIPDGLNIVAGNERYKADPNFIDGLMAQYKQGIGELSSAYTQELDSGTQKERTKFEVQALLAQTSALMASMLARAYMQEKFAYMEIARRFCIKNSHDFDVKKFQAAMVIAGVPDKYIDVEQWEIEVEQVLGSGNRAMELAEASELFQSRDAFDPEGQQEIKHDYALALTQNPAKAARLAGIGTGAKVTDSIHDAEQSFGTLMRGVDINLKEGYSHVQQVETMLRMMGQTIEQIMQSEGAQSAESIVGTHADVLGFTAVEKYIGKHLAIMEKDDKMQEKAKLYANNLKELMNISKAMDQRQKQAAEKAAQQNGGGEQADAQAKAAATMMTTQAKIQAGQASTQAKLQQGEQKHQQKLIHKEQDQEQSLRMKKLEGEVEMLLKQMDAITKMRTEAAVAVAKPRETKPAPGK